jgi:hypothetical protein
MDVFGDDSIMAAISLSSLDMRFSAAVNVPCDNGDGRAGRALDLGREDVLEDDPVDAVDTADGREGVTDEDDEDEDVFRWCGSGCGLWGCPLDELLPARDRALSF